MTLLAGALLLLGTALSVLGGIGLHTFGGTLARMHAATKPAVLGVVSLCAGGALLMPGAAAVKLLLVALLQLATAPVAMHVVGASASRRGAGPPAPGAGAAP